MRILVLGGTLFLGRTVAERARDAGHDVACLARGESGAPPDGVRHVLADRNRPGAYDSVADQDWDAVVDVSWQPAFVRGALDALAARTRHWTYVSSCSVYASHATPGSDETAPLLEPLEADVAGWDTYGEAKVACERACREAVGDRLHISRSGLLAGPGDRSDRVGYWPARFARGGEVLVPRDDGPAQLLDVRDLAAFLLLVAGTGKPLVVNAVGEQTSLRTVIDASESLASGVATRPSTRVEVDDDWLLAREVETFMGEDSLALWLPDPEWTGFSARDDTRAIDAGLARRPLAETLEAVLGDEMGLGLDRPRRAGLSAAKEAELLAAWQARG